MSAEPGGRAAPVREPGAGPAGAPRLVEHRLELDHGTPGDVAGTAVPQVPGRRWPAVLTRAGTVTVVLAAVAVPAAFLLLHRYDRARMDHSSGVLMALTQWARSGTLMPAPQQGAAYGGTRYMPLPMEIGSRVQAVVGDPVLSARLVAIGSALAALAVLGYALRRVGLPGWCCVLGVTAASVTPVMIGQLTSARTDAVAAATAVLGIAVLVRGRDGPPHRLRRVALSGALCGLAPVWKASELWAFAAVALWLLVADREPLRGERFLRSAVFCAGALGSLVAGTAWSLAATDGRLVHNLATLLAGEDSVLDVPAWSIRLIGAGLPGLGGLLLPAVAGLTFFAVRRRPAAGAGARPARSDVALLGSAAWSCATVTIVVYADRGVEMNHLVDVLLLGTVCAAAAALAVGLPLREPLLALLTFTTFLIAWWPHLLPIVNWQAEPLTDATRIAAGGGPVLSEDPGVIAVSGGVPVLLDSFAFRRMALRDPDLGPGLVARVDRQEFSAVLLLSTQRYRDPDWYSHMSFGQDVFSAVCRSYRVAGVTADGRFEVLRPARAGSPPPGPPAESVCDPTVRRG